MPIPLTNTPFMTKNYVQAEGYVQASGGLYSAGSDCYLKNIEVALGGNVTKGSTFANAEVGYGTAFRAKAEVGHGFNLNKKESIVLELAGNVEYLRENQKSSFRSAVVKENKEVALKSSWHDGYKKAGISSMVNFRSNHGNLKVGLESGYRANNAPDVCHQYKINVNNQYQEKSISAELHESRFYITPKVSAEVDFDKKGHWSAIADADMYKGNVGIRYTF